MKRITINCSRNVFRIHECNHVSLKRELTKLILLRKAIDRALLTPSLLTTASVVMVALYSNWTKANISIINILKAKSSDD